MKNRVAPPSNAPADTPESSASASAGASTAAASASASASASDPGASRALARQRHETILAEISNRGAVRVVELATLLGVSDMTIRRDLDVLDEAGLLEKVHGGATARANRRADEPGFEVKSLRNTNEKLAIAAAAATLVTPGTAIGIGAGTTTWQLACHLTDVENLIVVTNSIRVAEVLNQAPRMDRTVILTGGVRTPSDALVGPVADQALRTLHLDVLFMGAHGMSERAGFTSPNLVEAETNRAFVSAAQQLVILADHTKWDLTALSSFARLEEANTLVTDRNVSDAARAVIEERVNRIIFADPRDVEFDRRSTAGITDQTCQQPAGSTVSGRSRNSMFSGPTTRHSPADRASAENRIAARSNLLVSVTSPVLPPAMWAMMLYLHSSVPDGRERSWFAAITTLSLLSTGAAYANWRAIRANRRAPLEGLITVCMALLGAVLGLSQMLLPITATGHDQAMMIELFISGVASAAVLTFGASHRNFVAFQAPAHLLNAFCIVRGYNHLPLFLAPVAISYLVMLAGAHRVMSVAISEAIVGQAHGERLLGQLEIERDRVAAANEALEKQASRDPLTGVANRVRFLEQLEIELAGARRTRGTCRGAVHRPRSFQDRQRRVRARGR